MPSKFALSRACAHDCKLFNEKTQFINYGVGPKAGQCFCVWNESNDSKKWGDNCKVGNDVTMNSFVVEENGVSRHKNQILFVFCFVSSIHVQSM